MAPKNESKLDLAALRIEIPEDGKPIVSIPTKKSLACDCGCETFTGYANEYGMVRVCANCRKEEHLGGAFFPHPNYMLLSSADFPPPTKEQLEIEEADAIAEIRQMNMDSGTFRSYRDNWSDNEYEYNEDN